MTNTLFVGLACIMGFVFVFNSLVTWATESGPLEKYRMRAANAVPVADANKYLRISLSGLFSLALYAGFAYFFVDFVSKTGEIGLPRVIAEVVAIMLVYDFMYYWVHRGFHWQPLMRLVHGTHHKVRNPTVADGLYLDPWDNAAGLGLFFLSVLIIGPVSTATFLSAVFVYIMINNVNHTGLELPHPVFKLTNHWARKHDHHHGVNSRANYGSIFPFWDKMFGTYE